MKEITYINRNQERWKSFEKILEEKGDPDQLADQYIQVMDDLSYARTFYPKSKITSYLNRLALKIHQEIYKNKREKTNRIKLLVTQEVPLILHEARPSLLLALVLFVISAALGVVSALTDDTFIRLILPESYINTTLNNIQNGDPMGIYGEMSQFPMFIQITFNNVFVSFYTFILGLFTYIGTCYSLFSNGIMVGSFITFFYQQNLLSTSLYAIMIHGSLELSAITIAGGAGFILSKSILFPGTYSRAHSFKMGAKKGTKIMVILIPVFIVAGFLESFVTRYYQTMPSFIILTIIIASLSFIVWYFFVYPITVYHQLNQINHVSTTH